jgi:hypothetical protein
MRCTQRHALASLIAVASVSSLLVNSIDADETSRERTFYRRTLPSTGHCKCEENGHSAPGPATMEAATPKSLSRIIRLVYASKLYPYSYLPLPRLLTPLDPVFSYPELKRGLIRRHKDEERVRQILSSPQVMEARKNQDHEQTHIILRNMNSVVYGEGVSPQMREGKYHAGIWFMIQRLCNLTICVRLRTDFLIQYGCTGFTEEILQFLVQSFETRGIIEVGAGNGQWARALNDYHYEMIIKQRHQNESHHRHRRTLHRQFITAYDSMEALPLSPKVYHKNTIPANKYFFDKIHRSSHIDAVQGANGRVLLLVYPPPGPMALETVLAYLNASPKYSGSCKNDTVVYVGEGRGGANADEAFFDYFLGCNTSCEDTENHEWVLEKVMGVLACPGGKGYEKIFVFRRR